MKGTAVESPEWLTLCWSGRPLGRITEVRLCDWPWRYGKLTPGDWPPDLRASIQSLAHAAESDEDLPDPPYQSGHYDGWTVVDPVGAISEISVPKVNFSTWDIEWR
jgi:hypothetical protein